MKKSLTGVMLLSTLLMLVGGCASTPAVPPSAGGSDAAPTVAEEESGNREWPATLPTIVPQFTGAKITDGGAVAIAGTTMWSVSFGQTDREKLAAYIRELQVAGWASTDEEAIQQYLDMSQWVTDEQEKAIFFDRPGSDLVIILSLEKNYAAVRIDVANRQGTAE